MSYPETIDDVWDEAYRAGLEDARTRASVERRALFVELRELASRMSVNRINVEAAAVRLSDILDAVYEQAQREARA